MSKGLKISEALRTDLTGQRFGRLQVTAYGGTRYEKPQWLCQCDCGQQKLVCGRSLKTGRTKSCGCLSREVAATSKRTHGRSTSVEAKMFYAAKKRAKKNGLVFNLQLEDVVVPEFCPLLGLRLQTNAKGHAHNSPSLDRFDSSKGYVKGNVWVISHRANTLKGDASINELQTLALNLGSFLPATEEPINGN